MSWFFEEMFSYIKNSSDNMPGSINFDKNQHEFLN